MKLYADNNGYKIYNGNMLDMLEVIEPQSIDAIVCDPPYEIGFMNKKWDNTGIAFKKETWQTCLKVLKPGGFLLAFGGARTFHRIACAIEDAGFEIKNCIMWLYGSGFPKSNDIGLKIDKKNGVKSTVIGIGKSGSNSRAYSSEKATTAGNYTIKKAQNEWGGWGNDLKPAYEPIIVARKPVENSLIENVQKYRVGGYNVDECRVGEEIFYQQERLTKSSGIYDDKIVKAKIYTGRFPANVITDGSEEVAKGMSDAMRYFYCAKATTKDRDEGLETFSKVQMTDGSIGSNLKPQREFSGNNTPKTNFHPSVKPAELMQYLVRLVAPKGSTILDPFLGSGSTGKAVMFENRERNSNYKFVGIELSEEYLPLAQARIEYARDKFTYDLSQREKTTGEQNIFDFIERED